MKNTRGMAGQVAKAVKDLRDKLAKIDKIAKDDPRYDPIEHARLTELISLASGKGEVEPDLANQGENVKPIAKPRKF